MKIAAALFSIVLLGCAGAYAQPNPLDQGLLLRLGFGDLAGCRVTGTPRMQDGALLISQYSSVSVPAADLDRAVEQLTLSVWIAPSERPSSYWSLLYKGKRQGSEVQDIHFYLSLFDGRPEFKFKDENGQWQGIMRNGGNFLIPGAEPVPLASVPAVKPLHWNHVAATFDRGLISLYLNGEKLLEGRSPVNHLVPNQHPLLIGEAHADSGARSYMLSGLIDDVRVYGRALPAGEIAALYQYERQGKSDKPLTIQRPLPEGYDPEFKTVLPRVAEWEKHLPLDRVGRGPTQTAIKMHGGYPMLHVNGKPVYGMAMMPEPYASDEMITKSCRDFAASGVDLYSEIFWSWATPGKGCYGWWLGPGQYDFAKIDARIAAILAANPNALLLPRLKLNPPKWWLAQHPDEICANFGGKPAEQASLASELWEQTYEVMLRDVIRHMEASPYAAHIIGYHPAGGNASEWFWWGEHGRTDFCPAAIKRYRSWLGEQYGGNVEALRRAWGDPAASFETAQPPPPDVRSVTTHGIFRDPVRARPVIDYRRFMSAMVSRNIIRSCRIVKEETKGSKIAGVFYGYSTYCMAQDGFQGLADVLAAPEVDFLASPTAYDLRRGGQIGDFVSAYAGSYRLHGKLFWDEVDTRTHLYPDQIEYRTDDLPETLSVLERATGYSLTKGTSLWWFLLAGNCTFHQAEIMDDVARLRTACETALTDDRAPMAEVAIFADEPSMHYATGDYTTIRPLLRGALAEAGCMGAPFDTYLLSDIGNPKLPQYKLYIFLNAFKLDAFTRAKIDAVVKRQGKTAAWVYAPGYVTDTGFDESAMAALTGLTIKASNEPMPYDLAVTGPKHPITSAAPARRQEKWSLTPSFSVTDPGATILGTTSGKPTLAVREFGSWRSVYSALPLKRELLNGLCRYAGVHVYSDSYDPFFANAGYAVIHTATAGVKRLALPVAADVTELVTGKPLGKGLSVIEQDLPAGVTRIYRLQRR
ncbi:MAG: LamG-like jellyroll fold domain-containing protein [Armatimonadia bacterium]